jgi:hypothetical protein
LWDEGSLVGVWGSEEVFGFTHAFTISKPLGMRAPFGILGFLGVLQPLAMRASADT